MMRMATLLQCVLGLLLVTMVQSAVDFDDVETYLDLSDTNPVFQRARIRQIIPNFFERGSFILGTETTLFNARFRPESQKRLDVLVGSTSAVPGYKEGSGTEARFGYIRGLVRVGNRYIVSDSENHCLRAVEPPQQAGSTTWTTKTFAGSCTDSGVADGNKLNVRFNGPYAILLREEKLYITESRGRRLRRLDLNTGITETLHTSGAFELQGLVFNSATNDFYITVQHGILRVQDEKESWLVGWLEETNQKTNERFSSAGFANPEAIAWLDSNRLLVSDYESNTVKVVDLDKEEVDVLCPGTDMDSSDIKRCALNRPGSFLVVSQDNEILIGETGRVRKIRYNYVGEEPPIATPDPFENNAPVTFKTFEFCKEPDPVSSASYMVQDSYPENTVVHFECNEGYVKPKDSSNTMTCVKANGFLQWYGEVKCEPSASMIAMIILAVVCAGLLVALVCIVVKLVKTRARLQKANQQNSNPVTSPITTLDSEVSELSVMSQKPTGHVANDEDYYKIHDDPGYCVPSGHDDSGYCLPSGGYVNAAVPVPASRTPQNPEYLTMKECRTGTGAP